MSIFVEKRKGIYEVIFTDIAGMSILAKTKSKKSADSIAKRYKKYYSSGRLLKPMSSAYKL